MVLQWLSRLRRPGFDAQSVDSFLVLFHLIKVVRFRILAEEEGGLHGNSLPEYKAGWSISKLGLPRLLCIAWFYKMAPVFRNFWEFRGFSSLIFSKRETVPKGITFLKASQVKTKSLSNYLKREVPLEITTQVYFSGTNDTDSTRQWDQAVCHSGIILVLFSQNLALSYLCPIRIERNIIT